MAPPGQEIIRPLPITVAGETVCLLPERCVFWPRQMTLLAADLHWGKSETFQAHGIPVSSAVLTSDLERLDRALWETGAEHLVILGDLIHTQLGLTAQVIQAVSDWRQRHPSLQIRLIRGNHDRHLKHLPPEWNMALIEDQEILAPFVFSHHPRPSGDGYLWSGHLHPVIQIQAGLDALRLPCFQIGLEFAVIPAFSEFTGGFQIQPEPADRVYVIAENTIVPWQD